MKENRLDPRETYAVLDLDRTLINTELVNATYESIIAEHNQGLADAMELQKQADEAAGQSFDPHLYVRNALSDDISVVNDYERELVDRLKTNEEVLNPGARELIDQLRQWDVAHGILTYGHNDWQQIKLQIIIGLVGSIPYKIISDKRKGLEIGSWQSEEDGEFHTPVELSKELGSKAVFQSVVLLDDKAVSFKDLPEGVFGVWYRPSNNLLKSQQGEVPDSVTTVDHLDKAKKHLAEEFDLAA